MLFLLRKPWYARPKRVSDAESEVDRKDEGAEAVENSRWISTSDSEQNEAAFGIPDTTLDGDLSCSNTIIGASAPEVLSSLSYPKSAWETNAINSSQLPYADREEVIYPHRIIDTVVEVLARIDDEESGDIDAALAKLEG